MVIQVLCFGTRISPDLSVGLLPNLNRGGGGGGGVDGGALIP